MMKSFIFLLVAVLVAVHAKKELDLKDCGGEDAIITLGSLTDSKPAGAIDKKSKLNILFSVSESTKQLDPFDLYVEIKIQKAVMGLFWPVPSPIMDGIAKNIEKADKNVKYVGNKYSEILFRPPNTPIYTNAVSSSITLPSIMFLIHCPFKGIYGSCLPPKGPHIEELPLEPVFTSIKKTFGVFLRWFANGWYKVDVRALSMKKKSIFCVKSTMKIHI